MSCGQPFHHEQHSEGYFEESAGGGHGHADAAPDDFENPPGGEDGVPDDPSHCDDPGHEPGLVQDTAEHEVPSPRVIIAIS